MSNDFPSTKTFNPEYKGATRQVFERAAFVADVGMRLVDIAPGTVETELDVLPRHYQQTGFVHARVQATMADHTAGSAATTTLRADEYVLSAQISLNLMRPAAGQKLRCRAFVLKPGRRLVVVEAEIYAINNDRRVLVSKATVTLAVMRTEQAGHREATE